MSPPKAEAAAKLRDFLRQEITRCFFIALAASFARGASGIAEERVANVIIGGVFGLIAVALMELVWRRVGAGKVGVSQ